MSAASDPAVSRVMVVADLAEEGWPSMDFAAEATMTSLNVHAHGTVVPTLLCPPMVRRFGAGRQGRGYAADRLINRFWDYPRVVRRARERADLFHLVDHSYAQLVHALPAERTVVTCHDTDTFRCLTHPVDEPRSRPFRMMATRILSGLRKAASVCADSRATRDDLVSAGLVPEDRVRVVPLPAHPVFTPAPDPKADNRVMTLLGGRSMESVNILHVGSTIDRKRIDVLLRVVAGVRAQMPVVRLIRVGGRFTSSQEALVTRLNLADAVTVLPHLDRRVLAAVYRQAALVMLTPEREGFGLPVVEALASGTPVVTSDVPVLREVGGDAATYCPVGDVPGWVATVLELLNERSHAADAWGRRCASGLEQAQPFTFGRYAHQLTEVYQQVLHV